jgi:hypothetical protein
MEKYMEKFEHDIIKFLNIDSYDLSRGNIADYTKISDSDTLLITIGESWTWGDSLPADRLTNIWGYRLANKLQTDWLNIARCGASNFCIFYQLAELIRFTNNNKFPYKKIVFVFCLTETGRELTEDWDWYEHDPIKFFNNQRRDITVDDLVKKQNEYCIQYALTQSTILKNTIDHDIWISHNFCSPIYWKHPFNKIKKNWNQITAEKLNYSYNLDPSLIQSPIIEKYKNHLTQNPNLLCQLSTTQDTALSMIDFLDYSPLNYKKASKHPTSENHELWASYVYNNMCC